MKKQLSEWLLMIIIIGVLYFTGWYKDVAVFLQKGLLLTGAFDADTEYVTKEKIDYNLTLKSTQGDTLHLSELKGKVIFINMWATWCPPCKAEMPGIESLYKDFTDSTDVAFVMLALDSENRVKSYLKHFGYTFPAYTPMGGHIPEIYRPSSIPTTLIISPEGELVAKEVGMRNYDTKKYRRFLNKLAN
ncbi:TlpA family protein disulfide reductase [Fulvivirga maritima]|uniref:TlpA family protein disulfide reductase n=1 Tax=Fulvivirga maritima TaxID=2904247 RepID=UPI001F1CA105|nr:TlpA disulfide reductase family protein [Fulvivirga maritima]UII24940.1 TlpA family protein disulfide reductase [Fulvivirga maritima]